jgi:polysaccharide export outer membrane protein
MNQKTQHQSISGWVFLKEVTMALRRFGSFLLCLPFILFIISCASAPPPKKEITPSGIPTKEIESSRQVKEMNEKILMSLLSSKKDLDRDYKIGPEDLLEISVFEDEKLNKTVRVSSQGNISLPLLGVLRVKGLTSDELEREIRDLLAEKYLQDPNVNVLVKEYRNLKQISVFGAVQKPGIFEVTGRKTILDMLAVSGGLRDDAGQLLFLIRPPNLQEGASKEKKGSEEQTPKTFVIDLEDLLGKGDLTLNYPLVHGDIINIPTTGKIFVGGEVRSPNGFTKGKRLTVGQAITLAGGLTKEAAGSETRIFRYSGESSNGKEILSVDVYAIQKGQAEDLYLKDNDIIFVPRSGSKVFWSELWDFVKGRIGGMSLPPL